MIHGRRQEMKSETAMYDKLVAGGAAMPVESIMDSFQVPCGKVSLFCPRCNEMDVCECHEWDSGESDAVHTVWFMCSSCGYKSERKPHD